MRSATRSLAAPLLRHRRQLFRACSTFTPAKIRFRDLLRPELIRGLNLLDITSPNAIQSEALPPALNGEDLIVCAQTGSGKTLLFLLPMLQKLAEMAPPQQSFWSKSRRGRLSQKALDDDDDDWIEPFGGGSRKREKKAKKVTRHLAQPEAIILVPTRELAMQTATIANHLATQLNDGRQAAALEQSSSSSSSTQAHPVSVMTLTNGQRFTPERQALRDHGGARLVIATPQRLLYHLGENSLTLRRLRQLAIDEADAVLCGSDGVVREGLEVLRRLKKTKSRLSNATVKRQVLMTAATIGAEEEEVIRTLVPKATRRISHSGVLVPTLKRVYHYVRSDKDAELLKLLERSQSNSFLHDGGTLIFCGSVRRAARVHDLLNAAMPELRAVLVHGETRPDARTLALQKFNDDESRFLVCSDVATRGLDFPLVRHVIMYDQPRDVTAFIHRAGRTARKGQPGLLTCLIKPFEQPFYNQMREGEGVGTPLQIMSGREGRPARDVDASAEEGGADDEATLKSPEQRRRPLEQRRKRQARKAAHERKAGAAGVG